jgi:hypothetical protein
MEEMNTTDLTPPPLLPIQIKETYLPCEGDGEYSNCNHLDALAREVYDLIRMTEDLRQAAECHKAQYTSFTIRPIKAFTNKILNVITSILDINADLQDIIFSIDVERQEMYRYHSQHLNNWTPEEEEEEDMEEEEEEEYIIPSLSKKVKGGEGEGGDIDMKEEEVKKEDINMNEEEKVNT